MNARFLFHNFNKGSCDFCCNLSRGFLCFFLIELSGCRFIIFLLNFRALGNLYNLRFFFSLSRNYRFFLQHSFQLSSLWNRLFPKIFRDFQLFWWSQALVSTLKTFRCWIAKGMQLNEFFHRLRNFPIFTAGNGRICWGRSTRELNITYRIYFSRGWHWNFEKTLGSFEKKWIIVIKGQKT